MRKRTLSLTIAVLSITLLAGCASTPIRAANEDIRAVKAVFEEMKSAFEAEDIERLMALAAEDYADDQVRSKEEQRRIFEAAFAAGMADDLDFNIDEARVDINGPVAIFGPTFTSHPTRPGVLEDRFFLEKRDNKWLIVRVQENTGADPSEPSAAASLPVQSSPYNNKFQVGDEAPDFSGEGISAGTVKLSDYRGKVVLLDFWASWCGPCIVELPNVIEVYEKYHPQGLEIIGISLDSSRDALEEFLESHPKMTWSQAFDGQGWQSAVGQLYGVDAIPFTLLLDGTGKIRYRDLRGPALSQAVEAMLKESAARR